MESAGVDAAVVESQLPSSLEANDEAAGAAAAALTVDEPSAVNVAEGLGAGVAHVQVDDHILAEHLPEVHAEHAAGASHAMGHPLHAHSHHHHHAALDEGEAAQVALLFYLILFCLIIAQVGLFYWKKLHKRSYELVTLVGLWIIPAIISFELKFWRFFVVWLGYSGVISYLLYQIMVPKTMNMTTPRKVYTWFMSCHKVSVATGILGYGMLLLEVFGLGPVLDMFLPKGTSITVLWYGLYFGILGRDLAEVLSDRMSAVMGGKRRLAVTLNQCSICNGDLTGGDRLAHLRPESERPVALEDTITLTCKHVFHDRCIRGWTMVGKKDVCPVCGEKVDLVTLYKDRPWETRNLSWIQMLDAVRYLVVWNPVILVVLHFIFHATGLDHVAEHAHHHEHAAELDHAALDQHEVHGM